MSASFFFGMGAVTGNRTGRSTRSFDRYAHVVLRALDARNESAMESIGGGSAASAPRTPRTQRRATASKLASDSDGDDDPALAQLVNTLIERIAALSKPSIPIDIDLWDAKSIAAYLKRDVAVVRERIVCMSSFPASIRIPNSKGQRMQPLWKAAEVTAWAESFQSHKTVV